MAIHRCNQSVIISQLDDKPTFNLPSLLVQRDRTGVSTDNLSSIFIRYSHIVVGTFLSGENILKRAILRPCIDVHKTKVD